MCSVISENVTSTIHQPQATVSAIFFLLPRNLRTFVEGGQHLICGHLLQITLTPQIMTTRTVNLDTRSDTIVNIYLTLSGQRTSVEYISLDKTRISYKKPLGNLCFFPTFILIGHFLPLAAVVSTAFVQWDQSWLNSGKHLTNKKHDIKSVQYSITYLSTAAQYYQTHIQRKRAYMVMLNYLM